MDHAEYLRRLQRIEKIIGECKQAAPADGEMIRGDVMRLFNEISKLEADTRYIEVEKLDVVGRIKVRDDLNSRYKGQTLEVVEVKERKPRGGKNPNPPKRVDYRCKLPGYAHATGWFNFDEVEEFVS